MARRVYAGAGQNEEPRRTDGSVSDSRAAATGGAPHPPAERREGSQPNLGLVVFLGRGSQRLGRFGKVEVGEGVRREQSRGDFVVGEEVPEAASRLRRQ